MHYKSFERNALNIMLLIYIGAGLIQFFSISDFLLKYNLTILERFCIAVALSYTPIIGTVISLFSVIKVWHFSIVKSILLFLPISILMLFISVVFIVDSYKKNKR